LNFDRFSKISKKSKIAVEEKVLVKLAKFFSSKMKTSAKMKIVLLRFLGIFKAPFGNFGILVDFQKFQKSRKSVLGKKFW
jgi:hypothetical protein